MMDYKIIRSKRKTLALEVTRNLEVIVRAPMQMSQKRIEEFVVSHRAWLERAVKRVEQRLENMPEPTEQEIEELKKRAKQILPQKTEYFSKIIGVEPKYVKITSAKTRFGSCNANNGICYSYNLMRYDERAIDYVVVHELCHIIEKNHGKRFYALIEKYMPDYKMREKLLKTPIKS